MEEELKKYEYLLNKLNSQYGMEIKEKIIKGYFAKRAVTLRVNTIKSTKEKVCEELKRANILYENVSWSEDALIIKNAIEKDIENLEIYKQGEVYLQSLSSMLPPIILNPEKGIDILDMAAAPGGKTTELAAITENKSYITACEMNTIRLERLKYNIQKQGATSVTTLNKDARRLDDFFSFDKILLDAPCSGSGTIELNSEKNQDISERFINKLKKVQQELLNKAINLLKPGKELVYSTCSILEEENEEQIIQLMKRNDVEIVPIEIDGGEDIPKLPCKIDGAICVMPNELYEGFFVIKLRKK
ncbi:MAG: RsmB/NOP family class I SAM-dependent RNA methyltransferase [Clostridia bacterium]|nr:RsmB/NOP family class I SAM-dependent RNA methyltransferase [Clostridia bacterium]